MSSETKAALEIAIEAHIADEHGDETMLLSAYILQATGNGIKDSRHGLTYCALEGQSGLISLGLLAHINVNVENMTFGTDDD